ncbi:MAG TPA: hypothetical protein VEC36_11685 [Patescibacteria group bacterium]|nr:hypothetical protein [Patescibacteria group bacterium]
MTTAQDTTVFPKELIGKSILVTVPENDNDYDCVYVVTQDNQPMKIDFGGKVEKLSLQQQFYEPEIDFAKLEKPEVLKPAKTAFLKATQNTTIQKVDRPFWRGYIYFALWLIGFTALHKVDLKFAGIFIGWGFSNFLLYCRKSPWSTDVYRWVVTISFFIPGIIGLFYSDSYDLLFFCWALTIPFFHNIFDRLFKNLSIKYHGRDFYLYMNGSQEINTGFGAKNPHVRTTDILFSIALFIITSLLLMFPVFFKFF